jgi:hypothetical protein
MNWARVLQETREHNHQAPQPFHKALHKSVEHLEPAQEPAPAQEVEEVEEAEALLLSLLEVS